MELRNKLIGCGLCEDNEFLDKYIEIVQSPSNGPFTEEHHIIPRFWYSVNKLPVMNGNNLVKLTYKNHFLAHYYLMKCVDQSCYPFVAASAHAARCMIPTDSMGKYRESSWTKENLSQEELDELAELFDECKMKACVVSKWSWLIDYIKEKADKVANVLLFKVTDEFLETHAVTFQALYSTVRKFYTDGAFDKQPILYRDESEVRYKIPTLVHYIETHAVNGTFECTSEFLKEHSCTRRKILSYMDKYGSKQINISFDLYKTRKTILPEEKKKWAKYIIEHADENGIFSYSKELLEELGTSFKVLSTAARYAKRSGTSIKLLNLTQYTIKKKTLESEIERLTDFFKKSAGTNITIQSVHKLYKNVPYKMLRDLAEQYGVVLTDNIWVFPQIEDWFNDMLKTGRPVIISDEQAYNLMTQVDSSGYEGKPHEFARAKLDAYLLKRGYKHQSDFFMRETKSCHLYLLRKYITEHAIDGVFTAPDSMLDDWNINLTQLHTSCYAAKVRLVIPGREYVPRNAAMYDYIAKFPFGAKVPYTRELLDEFQVSSHKFGKACARHGKGVCKCKSLPL